MKSKTHSERVKKIAEKTGVDPRIINLIIKEFFRETKKNLLKNNKIYIKGFFKLKK